MGSFGRGHVGFLGWDSRRDLTHYVSLLIRGWGEVLGENEIKSKRGRFPETSRSIVSPVEADGGEDRLGHNVTKRSLGRHSP